MMQILSRLRPLLSGGKMTSAVLVALLVALIWYGGRALPSPFDTTWLRSVLILLVIGGFLSYSAFKRLKAKRDSQRMLSEVSGPNEADVLAQRFKEATDTLKRANRRGGDVVDLPWYLLIGPPGSGKTTALRHAGLNFPLELEGVDPRVKGVGGTRDCDWWFADEAILLDTAGRYTTQDSDAAADRNAWTAFLELIKKYRKRRPLNGIMVAVSSEILLTGDEDVRRQHALAVRQRVLELYRHLGTVIPVYFLVTKADLISGFSEFFETLSPAERKQVFGYTRHWHRDPSRSAPLLSDFDRQFSLLTERTATHTLDRIADEPGVKRKALVFGFPEQLRDLAAPLRDFISVSFDANRYEDEILLRGVYLTSGTQEGAPIDRLMANIARAVELDERATPTRMRGRSYFIENVLKETIFPEQDLLGFDRLASKRRQQFQLAAYAASALLLVGAIAAWSGAFVGERGRTARAASIYAAFLEDERLEVPALGTPLDRAIPQVDQRLDRLNDIAEEVRGLDGGGSLLGLPGRQSLGREAEDVYRAQLNDVLAPLVRDALSVAMEQSGDITFRSYASFDTPASTLFGWAYGAVREPDARLEGSTARTLFEDASGRALAAEGNVPQSDLAPHVATLLEKRPFTGRAVENDRLTGAQLRSDTRAVSDVPVAYRLWRHAQLTDGLTATGGLDAVLPDRVIGGAEDVFRRTDGDLSDPIPPLFLSDAKKNPFFPDGAGQVRDLASRSDWFFSGQPDTDAINAAYVEDYEEFWKSFLRKLKVETPIEAENLMTLSIDDGVLVQLLEFVRGQTQFYGGGALEGAADAVRSRTGGAANAVRERIEQEFVVLHDLFEGDEGAREIDAITRAIRTLADVSLAQRDGRPEPPADEALSDLNRNASYLKVGELDGLAALLDEVIRAADPLAGPSGFNAVADAFAREVVRECDRLIGERYPFGSSAGEVGTKDLQTVFAPNGLIMRFVNEQLSPVIDRTGSTWQWTAAAAGQGDDEALRQLQRADQISRAFFAGGALGASFDVEVLDLSTGATRSILRLGDQALIYQFGNPPRLAGVRWPGLSTSFEITGQDGSGGPQYFDGPWAFFRMLDQESFVPESQTRMRIILSEGGHRATYRLTANSVDNPFVTFEEWRQFTCPRGIW